MSERHLVRMFRDQVGMTPARFVEQARLEAAKVLLATGDHGQESWLDARVSARPTPCDAPSAVRSACHRACTAVVFARRGYIRTSRSASCC